jgi:hypothetical protein
MAPDDFGFQHDIMLQQGSRLLTKDAFSIDMTVELLADNVPVGTPIPIEVHGIGWRELEGSWVMLYDNRFTGWISTVTTGGTARFTLPAAGRSGRHVIEVVHSDFTFPYRNMQQSPAPDRPQFKVGFNITAGALVLPPPPPLQAQAQVRRLPPQGDLAATPAFSGVDQSVVVKGSGFAPGKTAALNWATVTGNRISGGAAVSTIASRMTSGSGDRSAATGGWEERSRQVAEAAAEGAGRSRRLPRAVGGHRDRRAQDRDVLGGTDRAAARRLPGTGRDHVQDSRQGRGLERVRQHLHRGL